MTRLFAAFAGGLLFGMGLVVSGMTEPARVIAFLNIGPDWNAALIVVMVSALLVTLVGYRLLAGRVAPLFDEVFHTPTNQTLDVRLMTGAALFGVGWGVAGYCPGPAIVGGFLLDERALVFLVGYLIGALAFEGYDRKVSQPALADG